MFTFIAQNKYGEQLEISHNAAFSIVNISGFDPPDSTINATHFAGADGAVYNSSYMNPRTITITLAINGPAEENRLALYQYFKSKEPVRLYYRTDTRNVYIDGFVQSFTVAYFDKKETAQIVVYCPRPQLLQAGPEQENIADMTGPLFEFPFAIEEEGIPFSEAVEEMTITVINYGDLETGVKIRIHARDAMTNPKIYNENTGEHLFINYSMQAGDDIEVNTIPGEKSVTLIRGGVETGILGAMAAGSSWLRLVPGMNSIIVTADSGAAEMVITFDTIAMFEGV